MRLIEFYAWQLGKLAKLRAIFFAGKNSRNALHLNLLVNQTGFQHASDGWRIAKEFCPFATAG